MNEQRDVDCRGLCRKRTSIGETDGARGNKLISLNQDRGETEEGESAAGGGKKFDRYVLTKNILAGLKCVSSQKYNCSVQCYSAEYAIKLYIHQNTHIKIRLIVKILCEKQKIATATPI